MREPKTHVITAPAADPGPRICFCMKVHLATLEAAIAAGARSVAGLRDATRASAGCGTCRPDLEAILRARLGPHAREDGG